MARKPAEDKVERHPRSDRLNDIAKHIEFLLARNVETQREVLELRDELSVLWGWET
jgi:hypothetical protein